MLFVSCPFLKETPMRIDDSCIFAYEVKQKILSSLEFGDSDLYLLYNGKQVPDNTTLTNGIVHAVPRLVGGKGGFGSMLRAIGAQIEKTTNREACRDLSGRRLRDINEEKRLKNWIAQQAEREREAAERKRRKLERLQEQPKHNFHDQTYEKERSQLTENVSDAVEKGFQIATKNNGSTGCSQKRKALNTATNAVKKKKGCLWVDADEECLSSSDSNSDSGDDIQPETSVKRGGITVNIQEACDEVVAVSDGSPSSDSPEDREPEGAVEDGQMTAIETTSK